MLPFTSELFEFNKMIFIYLITSLILFFWLLKIIFHRKIILKRTNLDLPIFIFLTSQLIATVFSLDPHTSFFGYYGRFNGGFLSIITYLILFYGFVSNFSGEKDKEFLLLLLKTSLISSAVVVLWGLPARFGYDLSCLIFTGQWNNFCWSDQFRPSERMFSTLGQPNWLGAYLVVNFFIGLYFFISQKSITKSYFWFFYLIFNFTAVIFTRSRSALLAHIISLFFLITCLFFLRGFSLKRKLLILLSTILIPILVFKTGIEKVDKYLNFWQFILSQQVHHQESQSKDSSPLKIKVTDSFDIRKIVWKGAIDLSKKYPFFGTGVETFAYAYFFVRPKEHNLTSEWDYLYNKAHNEYLNYLATTGFFGLIGYLFMIFFVFRLFSLNFLQSYTQKSSTIPNFKLINLCLLTAYLSILITNFFGFSTTTINLFFYLIPAFFIIINPLFNSQEKKDNENQSLVEVTKKQKLLFVILMFFTFYLLFFIAKYWLADYYYAKADLAFKNNQYQLAVYYLKEKALKLKYEHVYEDKLSYILANLAFLSYYQKEKNYASSLKNLSIYYNNRSLSQLPKNVLYWKTKAKIYYLFFQMDLDKKNLQIAIEALKKAQTLSPTDPKIPYTLAFFNLILYEQVKDNKEKDFYKKESLKAINDSIELKNNMIEAYLLKGQMLKKYEKVDEAKKVYRYILNNLDPQNDEAKKELNIN